MVMDVRPVEELNKLAREKSNDHSVKRVPPTLLEDAKAHGWVPEKTYKGGDTQVKKIKPYGIAIRDRLWSVLHKMQFVYMSCDDPVQLFPEGKTPLRHPIEIDTVCLNNEVAVAAFLKTSPEERDADLQFRQELEAYNLARSPFLNQVKQIYRGSEQRSKIKAAFAIFACNVRVSDVDKKFAREKSIAIFDENDLEYYEELVEQIGAAAKYQFLADILDDADIPALNISVPAIRLKAGKIVYYSFAIQPEYLLKISYIAHRARGKKADLDAYQRMAEKSRLVEMQEYIKRPAIFPTNIVINLKKKPRFDEIKLQLPDTQCGELGVLKLRSSYKSAWVIDGQHRLYSYSGLSKASDTLLSVIAFDDLPADLQAEFFIDINSKQKRVQASFYQELFDKVHRDAPDPEDRMKSLISQAIEQLNSERDSAFYERVLKAEEKKNKQRCLSWPTIFHAISDPVFTGKESGIFYAKGDDDATRERIVYIVKQWFAVLKKDVPSWWNAGSGVGGGLAMNDSIAACFQVLKNICLYLLEKHNLVALNNQELFEKIQPYAIVVSKHLASLTKDGRETFRRYGRGSQGQTQRARTLLVAIHTSLPEFIPSTLKEYMQEQKSGDVQLLLDDTKQILLDLSMITLQAEFGEGELWWEGVPPATRQSVWQRYENDKGRRGEKEAYIDFDDYALLIKENWHQFKSTLEHGGAHVYSEGILGGIQKMKAIQDLVNQGKAITTEQMEEINLYNSWLRHHLS